MPKRSGIKEEQLSASSIHLKPYDKSKRLVLGAIHLSINVSPIESSIEFQVLDIPITFNLTLGRSWLHDHKVVPSCLYQKVKMIMKGEVVIAEGDRLYDMITNKGPVPEIEHHHDDEELYNFKTVMALEKDKAAFGSDPYSNLNVNYVHP